MSSIAKTLKIGVLAYPIEGVTLEGYAAKLDRLVAEAAAAGAELLLMPEYACVEVASGYVSSPDIDAELNAVCARSAGILAAQRDAAVKYGVWLAPGSVPVRGADGVTINRAPLFAPDGSVAFQDKRVMTRFENEHWFVSPGAPPGIFNTPWGKIGLTICYDTEFPILARAQVEAGAWLILAPCCTDTLRGYNRVGFSARARALENQCYVAVAPTVGDAAWSGALDTNRGYAAVYGPVDRGFPEDGMLARGALDEPGWIYATLDPAKIQDVRVNGGVLNHRDWPASVGACAILPRGTLEIA
ncbi:Carbon-nitrogen hydrolase family protein [Granulibacter bethesdensis]|uniref:carbon-nitrogen hydrolase family protein n=1 Tax=Granulibacter bethesdensis TaxID=364410 RepID=UPI00090B5820|nr:carbon-nitrogen hydrolase family protein [Granulibacter bethesdensis]APH57270.1 Carbon-nitrogen hydrolase family protein [Granulibacter bethesdensis]